MSTKSVMHDRIEYKIGHLSVGDGSVVPACVISTRVNVTSMCLLSVNASFVIKSHCLPKTLLCVKRSRLIPIVRYKYDLKCGPRQYERE